MLHSGYLITTPKEVNLGSKTQFCIFVTDPNAPEGTVAFEVGKSSPFLDINATVVVFNESISVPAGE